MILTMTHLILVHGAWHNSNCWNPIIPLLSPYIGVSSPDLVNSSIPIQQYKTIHLIDYIKTLSQLLESIEGPVILAGHSFAGFVISELASRLPHRISLLIYINAYIPLPNESLFSITPTLKSHHLSPHLSIDEQNSSISFSSPAVFDKYMYNNSSSIPKLRLQEPLIPFQEPVSLTQDFFNIPKHAIIGQNDLTLTLADQLYMCERQNVAYTIIDTDHCPFSSNPNRLADLLLHLRK